MMSLCHYATYVESNHSSSEFFDSSVDKVDLLEFLLSKLDILDNCKDGLEEDGEAPAYNFLVLLFILLCNFCDFIYIKNISYILLIFY